MSLFDAPERELLPYDGSAMHFDWVLGDLDASAVFMDLLKNIPWESRTIKMFGKEHPQPRLVAWFGDPGRGYTYSGVSMNINPWTSQLETLKTICEQKAGRSFNSLLLNLYRNGEDKVSWHSDDEPELGSEPCIASLSLGAVRRFKFRHRDSKEIVDCSLTPGSLVVMSGLSQTKWEHEVPKELRVREPRINLTFRNVNAA
jgi:alkylated DNA repair dioxygenase AlkB